MQLTRCHKSSLYDSLGSTVRRFLAVTLQYMTVYEEVLNLAENLILRSINSICCRQHLKCHSSQHFTYALRMCIVFQFPSDCHSITMHTVLGEPF